MVRYPQNSPSEPPKPQAQPVPLKIVKDVKDEQIAETPPVHIVKEVKEEKVKDEKVEELRQRLYSLEEKLKDIEKQGQVNTGDAAVKNDPRTGKTLVELLRQYRTVLVIAFVFCILFLLAWALIAHLYVASWALKLDPKEFNVQGTTHSFADGKIVKLEMSSGLINEVSNLYVMKVKIEQDGRSLEARIISLGPDKTQQIAENWEKNFSQKYTAYRKDFLRGLLNTGHNEYVQTQSQLEDTYAQMSTFKPNEEYFLVNATSKEKLVQLAKDDALDLEKDLINIKDQLANGPSNKFLSGLSSENKVLLGTYHLKLTDVEFKKFLVGADFSSIYEEGERTIKSAAAKLINDQAQKQGLDEIAASLIIKDFFLSSRQQTIEAVLNKRYVADPDELSSRLAQYVQLKEKFEELDLKLTNISSEDHLINKTLEEGLTQEIIIRSPIKITKY